jgi:hypothetical protein
MMLRLALTIIGLCSACADALYEPKTVHTSSGKVRGHLAEWPAGSEVSEYLGIPYALPPVRQLRFVAPKAYKGGNNTILQGDKYVRQ